jgi:hypothetical protein
VKSSRRIFHSLRHKGLIAALIRNRPIKDVRILLPNRIASKIASPNDWIDEVKRDCENAKKRSSASPESLENRRGQLEKVIKTVSDEFHIERTVNGYSHIATPGCPETQLQHVNLTGHKKDFYIIEAYLAPGSPSGSPDPVGPITARWEEIIRQPIIPFDPARRRHELKQAYKVLEQFINSHEAMKRNGVLH